MKKLCIIVSLLLLIAFALVHLFGRVHPAVTLPRPSRAVMSKTSSDEKSCDAQKLLSEKIQALTSSYRNDCDAMLKEFQQALQGIVSPDFEQAKRAVPEVTDHFCKFNVCRKLCFKAAKDKLKGTSDFNDALMEVMAGPIIQPCLRAHMKASDALKQLEIRLQERYSQYCADLASVCKNAEQSAQLPEQDLAALQSCVNTAAGKIHQLALEKMTATIGGVLEVVFLRETCSLALKLIAKPVAKICSSVGVAGILAVADGPLPIGDIVGGVIAVGGLAWTAYDIYHVTKVLPQELRAELNSGITKTHEALLRQTAEKANALVAAWQKAGAEVEASAVQQLQ